MPRYRVVADRIPLGEHKVEDSHGRIKLQYETSVRCDNCHIEDLLGSGKDRIVGYFSDINIADKICEFLNIDENNKKVA